SQMIALTSERIRFPLSVSKTFSMRRITTPYSALNNYKNDLPSFKCQIGIKTSSTTHRTNDVILSDTYQKNDKLNSKHLVQMKVLTLVQQQDSDTTFRTRNAFDHCQHHPTDRHILPQNLDCLICSS